MVDLSDEYGDVKNLPENPTLYASQFLEARGVFILIKVESKPAPLPSIFLSVWLCSLDWISCSCFSEGEQDRPAIYTPLLNNLGMINPKALGK